MMKTSVFVPWTLGWLMFVALVNVPSRAAETLISAGALWKYLDDGSNQGTAWKEPAFDDAAWLSGPAELGYGDGDERTVVNSGANTSGHFVTTYFRHAFNLPSGSSNATLRIKRDDGAVVYLNGMEIFRSNMP